MATEKRVHSHEGQDLQGKAGDEQPLTVLWAQIQEWQQDNHYIHGGYRPASNSYWKSAASLGYIHNESVNIWSHLMGSIAFAVGSGFCYSVVRPRYPYATQDDFLVFSCFFVGAVTCMGMSATYHAIANHSRAVSRFGNQLDYVSIVFLIIGSFIPSIHYGFACDPDLITLYWTMITTIGAGCAVVSMSPKFASPQWRPFRASMFAAMGLSAVFPVFHGLKLYGVQRMVDLIGLPWLVFQGTLYVAGAAIYAMRVPERWRPGSFDIWGSSHNIFHLLVVAAAVAHLIGLLKAFDFHHSAGLAHACSVSRS